LPRANTDDSQFLKKLIEAAKVTSVVDSRHSLSESPTPSGI